MKNLKSILLGLLSLAIFFFIFWLGHETTVAWWSFPTVLTASAACFASAMAAIVNWQ